MEFEMKHYSSLPCSLEVFKINGIHADEYDFGEKESSGNCMENTCHYEFIPKLPTNEVLEKYGITLDEYSEICDALVDELYVCGCGWCS